MHFTKKRRSKPLYKKFLPLRKNVQDRGKLMKFKKRKWQKFQRLISKFKKTQFYDPISHSLFNFKNFFSRKFKNNLQNKQRLSFFYGSLRKSCLKRLVKSTLKEFPADQAHVDVLIWQRHTANSIEIEIQHMPVHSR